MPSNASSSPPPVILLHLSLRQRGHHPKPRSASSPSSDLHHQTLLLHRRRPSSPLSPGSASSPSSDLGDGEDGDIRRRKSVKSTAISEERGRGQYTTAVAPPVLGASAAPHCVNPNGKEKRENRRERQRANC
ncbi:uncharacterized protein G2W53_026399 [Senna tora]|uniref:Uncharacterized protein n=1 Tax=Senna tora TaxID=362788 RepID=A0A834TH40_9FABA|nr:uncharacterized protein G2W53_026399 [Senna tora]